MVASVGCGQHSASPAAAAEAPVKSVEKVLQLHPEIPEGEPPRLSGVVPFGTRIPAGTAITVRLVEPLSSENAGTGQAFEGIVDENVTLDGQVLMEHGTPVRGRVVESSARRVNRAPGFLRLTLTEASIGGKSMPVRTYSAFFKGAGSRRRSVANSFPGERLVADTAVLNRASGADDEDQSGPEIIEVPKAADVRLGVERRLTFHLLEPLSVSVP
jgi:hypothetical protein